MRELWRVSSTITYIMWRMAVLHLHTHRSSARVAVVYSSHGICVYMCTHTHAKKNTKIHSIDSENLRVKKSKYQKKNYFRFFNHLFNFLPGCKRQFL